jgi:hypothetical protein
MKAKIWVTALRWENYNYGGKRAKWRAKGEHLFSIELDSDLLYYSDYELVEAFKKMIATHDNKLNRFEYIGYDVQSYEPTHLGTEDHFKQLLETIST